MLKLQREGLHAPMDSKDDKIGKGRNLYIRRLPQCAIHQIDYYLLYISLLILIPNSTLFILFNFNIT
jgi:hypothetical protein